MSFKTNRVSGSEQSCQSVNHMAMEIGSHPPVITTLGIDVIILELPGAHTIELGVA